MLIVAKYCLICVIRIVMEYSSCYKALVRYTETLHTSHSPNLSQKHSSNFSEKFIGNENGKL